MSIDGDSRGALTASPVSRTTVLSLIVQVSRIAAEGLLLGSLQTEDSDDTDTEPYDQPSNTGKRA